MSVADLDRAAWAADERAAARAATLGHPHPDDQPLTSPEQQRFLRLANGRPAFELATLPDAGNRPRIPQVRHDLIAFCRQHPGEWVRYNAAGHDDSGAQALRKSIDSGTGGFTTGFECRVREGGSALYVRYHGGQVDR